MACSSCGGKGRSRGRSPAPANATASINRVQSTALPGDDLSANPNYVQVTYQGPNGNHFIPSPTRKVRHYGYGSNGSKLYVHREDIARRPDLFIPVSPDPGIPVAAIEPQTQEIPVVAVVVPEDLPPVPEPSTEPQESADVPDPDDLTQIDGVGPARAQKLIDAGYMTWRSVSEATPEALTELFGSLVTVEAAQDIIDSAKALVA